MQETLYNGQTEKNVEGGRTLLHRVDESDMKLQSNSLIKRGESSNFMDVIPWRWWRKR